MKKPFTMRAKKSAFLSVMLLFILLLASGAAADAKDITLFDVAAGKWKDDYTQNVAAVGGTLYIARADGLYAWQYGQEAVRLIDFAKTGLDGAATDGKADTILTIAYLMSENGVLFALDSKMEGLWRFDEAACTFAKEATFEPGEALLENGKDSFIFANFLLDRGDVYYTALNTMSGSSNLVKLSTKSGKAEVAKAGVCLAAPYMPGKLLVADGPMGWPESVSVLELQTGRLIKKMDISNDINGMYYDSDLDTLYLVHKGTVYTSVAFGEQKAAARIPFIRPIGGTQLNGGYVVLAYENGVRVCKCDPDTVGGASLTVVGQSWELPVEAYSVQNPSVSIAFSDFYAENTMDMVAHMSGEGAGDIYVLYPPAYNLDALFEKGYYAGLEASGTISDTISAMYPFIRDRLMRDGRIIALPYTSTYTVDMYNPSAFEEVGLSIADVPATYDELLDFITQWGGKYREEYSTMSLFGQGADSLVYRRIIARSILEGRMYDCIRRGQAVTYDTPEIRALLEKLLATDFEVIDALAPDASYEEYSDGNHPPRQLFCIASTASTQKAYTDFFSYMPLQLSEKEEPVIVCDPQVLLINPYSRNYDAALAFVEYVAASMPQTLRTDLMPGENEPQRNPSFDVKTLTETISKLEEIVKTAKEEDRRSYQDQLDMWRRELENEQRFEWLITEESIAAFRALDPYFVFIRPNPLSGTENHQEISDLFYNRFLQGQLTAEQFLKELDQKMRMAQQED